MPKNIEIRNSTAEFLIFMFEGKEDGIQVMYKEESLVPYVETGHGRDDPQLPGRYGGRRSYCRRIGFRF